MSEPAAPRAPAIGAGWSVDVAASWGAQRAADPIDDAELPMPPPAQAPLPTLRRVVTPGPDPFAHPAEREFSRLLSYYRVRWVYEPTSFALAWDERGRAVECFTPDFYLPDHHLYIELTTMRQRLVTRKNRKMRLLREIYPDVRIKLLYRRDFARIAEVFPQPDELDRPVRIGRVVFPEAAIRARLDRIAADLAADLAPVDPAEPPLLLGVGREPCRFCEAIANRLRQHGLTLPRDRIDVSRYRLQASAATVAVRRPPAAPLAGRHVIVVTDMINTGLTLAYLWEWLRRKGAAQITGCALLSRDSARLIDTPVRHIGFEAPDEPLAGWGLRLRRQYRELPYIAAIELDDDIAPNC
ncbi:MAG TPA: phosphoribosyltransferase family protein [Thermomicrobiales bacterium]|nr:phosphoribosyltransferase family protein [Thermomicrobiales bacterium]